MYLIVKREVANIPLLEVARKDLFKEALPTVFFFHGVSSIKEQNLNYAYLLAEKNLRVVLPDANYHGERQKSVSNKEVTFNFWRIIIQSIYELEKLKEVYIKEEKTLEDKIGVAGTSMGAITTLGALSRYPWIRAAVSLMGSPSYGSFAKFLINQVKEQGETLPFSEAEIENEIQKLKPFDLSIHPEKLNNRPLLFWHGEKDDIVPIQFAKSFYEENYFRFKDSPEKFQLIVDKNAGHKVSIEGMKQCANWFDQFLNE